MLLQLHNLAVTNVIVVYRLAMSRLFLRIPIAHSIFLMSLQLITASYYTKNAEVYSNAKDILAP